MANDCFFCIVGVDVAISGVYRRLKNYARTRSIDQKLSLVMNCRNCTKLPQLTFSHQQSKSSYFVDWSCGFLLSIPHCSNSVDNKGPQLHATKS